MTKLAYPATYLLGEQVNPHPMLHFFVTTPTVIATLDAIVAEAGLTLLASQLGATGVPLGVLCAGSLIVVWLALLSAQVRCGCSCAGWKERLVPSPKPAGGQEG